MSHGVGDSPEELKNLVRIQDILSSVNMRLKLLIHLGRHLKALPKGLYFGGSSSLAGNLAVLLMHYLHDGCRRLLNRT